MKVSENSKIEFKPTTKEERLHLFKLKELIVKKRRGDWQLVAEIIGITPKNAEVSFFRVHSKYHSKSVDALESVIESRSQLLSSK